MLLNHDVHAFIAACSFLVYNTYWIGKSWERIILLSAIDLYIAESKGFTFGRASGFSVLILYFSGNLQLLVLVLVGQIPGFGR